MVEKVALANLPTPLEPLDRLTENWGGPRIWVKRDDLTGFITHQIQDTFPDWVTGAALHTFQSSGILLPLSAIATRAAYARNYFG